MSINIEIYPEIPAYNQYDGVRFMHPDLVNMLDKYTTVHDVLKGSERIKEQTTLYLSKPNPDDVSIENSWRYSAYLQRAVFYNVTGRTQRSLVGQVFSTAPIIQLPKALDVVGSNENGKYIPLAQTAKLAVAYTLAYGRSGIFVDFPQTNGIITVADKFRYKPVFRVYKPWDIINWKTSTVDEVEVLTLLVLREKILVPSDTDRFYQSYGERFRVLELIDGIFYHSIYESNVVYGDLTLVHSFVPTDAKGEPFDHITYKFVGATNNDSEVDDPPLYDLAEVNISHYRNSADYEEGAFICGQPTLILSGLTQDWVSTVFGDKPILLGSRSAIPLPQQADAKLIQAAANSIAIEAMKSKESQMVALGAKLIERQVSRTAYETALDKSGDVSVLADIAANVTDAFTQALNMAMAYTTPIKSDILFSLTTNFEFTSMSNQDRLALIQEYQSGVISWSEARHVLRRGGIATQPDLEARDEIDKDMPVGNQEHLIGGDVKKTNVDNGASTNDKA